MHPEDLFTGLEPPSPPAGRCRVLAPTGIAPHHAWHPIGCRRLHGSRPNTAFPLPYPHRLGSPFPGSFLIKDIVTFDGKRLTKSANG